MTWWLLQSSRLALEKLKLSELEGQVDWLFVENWYSTNDLTMCIDFGIMHNSNNYKFKLSFPSVFPDTPPMIFTHDGTRISNHQYGVEGELCLEYRPDNWNQSITAADMVSSCYRLLDEEHPEDSEVVHAHSAHVTSLGRDLRSKVFRLLMNENSNNALSSLTEQKPEKIILKQRYSSVSLVSTVVLVGDEETPIWSSGFDIPESSKVNGWVINIPDETIPKTITLKFLVPLLQKFAAEDICKSIVESDDRLYILLGSLNNWVMVLIYGQSSDRKTETFSTVSIPEDMQRKPIEFVSLRDKKVGIVGCGSIGSKVAASLCRSGINDFLLIDDDIFFPANVVRNELDLRDIGSHKAYAVKQRLNSINLLCTVNAIRISLGGQESSGSISGALEALSKCDIIIDATAEPKAFNLMASVAKRSRIPMVWCEVLAGGIGGYICRSRPDFDPTPISARDQIQTWCADQGVEWIINGDDSGYSGSNKDGEPMIADDAEVSIIASHTTRFVTDILARPDSSLFPSSAYFIGFSSDWLFTQPFATYPLDLKPDSKWGGLVDEISGEELIELLNEHLAKEDDQCNY